MTLERIKENLGLSRVFELNNKISIHFFVRINIIFMVIGNHLQCIIFLAIASFARKEPY